MITSLKNIVSWVVSFFRKKELVCTWNCYTPGDCLIYSYFAGKLQRQADPMELFLKIKAAQPGLGIDASVASIDQMKDSDKAKKALATKLREIFNVKPFEEGGLTVTEIIDLWTH